MSFKIKSKLLRGAHRDITVPIPKLMDIFGSQMGSIYIRAGGGGLVIESHPLGGGPPVSLWEDGQLDVKGVRGMKPMTIEMA